MTTGTPTKRITDDLRSFLGKRVYLYSRHGEQLANGILERNWCHSTANGYIMPDRFVLQIDGQSRMYFTSADVLSADDLIVTFR